MREDFALELNAFKPELPTLLFENFYRLERLTIDNAKQAIVTPLARFGFRYEDGLLETLIKDLSQREQLDRFGKVAEVVDLHLVVEPPNLQIVCMQLWEIEKNNPHHQITRVVYESQGGAKGLSKNYFHKQIKNFAAAEKKLASAAFNYLVNKHGTKMAHPVGDLAKLLRVDEAALTQTLDKLEQARVLRRQIRLNTTDQGERRILWYELYHDIFSKIIYDWNESYKNRQRLFRLALGVIFVASTAGAIVLGYDFWINHTSYHVRLSLKSGISDTIELYQGKAGAMDIFKQQAYLYETDYTRTDIEADKLFNYQSVETLGQLNKELVEKFHLANRLQAYWDNGEFSKTACLANILKNDKNLLTATLTRLTHFRSVKNFEQLKQFVQQGNPQLKAAIQSTLLNIQAPPRIWFSLQQEPSLHDVTTLALAHLGYQETVNDLVKLLKASDWKIRNSAVQALGTLQASAAIPELIKLLKDIDEDVRNNAVLALGQIRTEQAITPLIKLFNRERDPDVRQSIALVLVDWGNEEAISALIELLKSIHAKVTITPKPLQAHRWQTFITRLQQEDVTTQRRALELFAAIPTKLAVAAISQLPPLLAANATRYKTLQLLQTIVPLWSEPKDKFPGLAQIEAILNEPPEKDPATGAYHEKLANQFVALKILGELGLEATAASIIKLIEPSPEYKENLFALDVYAALGNIPGDANLAFLKERLEQLDQAKREWRHERDQTETSSKSTDPCQSSIISDDKGKNDKPKKNEPGKEWSFLQAEFELGYAITRRDPQFGIELLEHNLAYVRNGAWVALGKIKDVELLKTLIQQRAANPDKPHFRHAAYRAIDNMLITLEYEGNQDDLAALEKFLPQVEDAATQDRIQWTIYQLEYRCERLKSCE